MGGGTYLGWEGYLPWTGGRGYLSWTGYAASGTPLAASPPDDFVANYIKMFAFANKTFIYRYVCTFMYIFYSDMIDAIWKLKYMYDSFTAQFSVSCVVVFVQMT